MVPSVIVEIATLQTLQLELAALRHFPQHALPRCKAAVRQEEIQGLQRAMFSRVAPRVNAELVRLGRLAQRTAPPLIWVAVPTLGYATQSLLETPARAAAV